MESAIVQTFRTLDNYQAIQPAWFAFLRGFEPPAAGQLMGIFVGLSGAERLVNGF